MRVWVNDKEIDVFEGATVKDALMTFSMDVYLAVEKGERQVTDKNGNGLGLNGELSEGSTLYTES